MRSGESEAIVIVKAAPQVGQRHGETVCCAGIDLEGNWLRLYPISFRTLEEGQRFGRWDRIRFRWRRPKDDGRMESRRVNQASLQIVGKLRKSERERVLSRLIVTGLNEERRAGRSFALLRAEFISFAVERKSDDELEKEARVFEEIRNQPDLFYAKHVIPYKPCPFKFKYRHKSDDGEREGTCQDWEIEATYYKWSKEYGETYALREMQRVFGEEYPSKGMLLAMGTHSRYPETWLINGIIRLDEISQLSLF